MPDTERLGIIEVLIAIYATSRRMAMPVRPDTDPRTDDSWEKVRRALLDPGISVVNAKLGPDVLGWLGIGAQWVWEEVNGIAVTEGLASIRDQARDIIAVTEGEHRQGTGEMRRRAARAWDRRAGRLSGDPMHEPARVEALSQVWRLVGPTDPMGQRAMHVLAEREAGEEHETRERLLGCAAGAIAAMYLHQSDPRTSEPDREQARRAGRKLANGHTDRTTQRLASETIQASGLNPEELERACRELDLTTIEHLDETARYGFTEGGTEPRTPNGCAHAIAFACWAHAQRVVYRHGGNGPEGIWLGTYERTDPDPVLTATTRHVLHAIDAAERTARGDPLVLAGIAMLRAHECEGRRDWDRATHWHRVVADNVLRGKVGNEHPAQTRLNVARHMWNRGLMHEARGWTSGNDRETGRFAAIVDWLRSEEPDVRGGWTSEHERVREQARGYLGTGQTIAAAQVAEEHCRVHGHDDPEPWAIAAEVFAHMQYWRSACEAVAEATGRGIAEQRATRLATLCGQATGRQTGRQ